MTPEKVFGSSNSNVFFSVRPKKGVTQSDHQTTINEEKPCNQMNGHTDSQLLLELEEMRAREKKYLARIDSVEEENKKFRMVAMEFDGMFHQLIKDKEESETKLKNEIIELTKERDHLQEDVVGVERAFDDLHRRFEKLKIKVEEFKKVGF
jgi:hypothetical protein